MKIREVRIQNFRNFGPALRTISFVDELTDQVRPLSVLVGSNGCGKTTVLQTIEGLLHFAVEGDRGEEFLDELAASGLTELTLGFSDTRPDDIPQVMRVAVGQLGRARIDYKSLYGSRDIVAVTDERWYTRESPRSALCDWVESMTSGGSTLVGGLLFFPHQRWIEHEQKGTIGEPEGPRSPWLFRFDPTKSWEGSLSQLWVWQNYLDLEEAREGRKNLAPFVETIETILGGDRRVVIHKGRVTIQHPTRGSVELHQLPSGEQQILTLFGEIVRRLRPGAVLMIDEVEISLHPALQRVVLFHLRALARAYDLQVILTTHSMEIVSAVAPEEVINLDDMVLAERAQATGVET